MSERRRRNFGSRISDLGFDDSALRTPVAGFHSDVTGEDIRRERVKARELRRSQWWKRRCSKGICHYCGRQVAAKALTMDHVVPLARGGRSVKGNLVPCCKECNDRKKHRLAFELDET